MYQVVSGITEITSPFAATKKMPSFSSLPSLRPNFCSKASGS